MDTHYNIHARACGCAYRCVDGRRKGKEWERKRITAAVKNIRTFFKKTVIFLENGLILFRKDKESGPERKGHTTTYPENSVHIRTIHTKHLQQSFAKLLPLLPLFLLKPRWTGRFKGWWQHLFLYRKKGCCHHFHLFFTPERPVEGEDTGGGEGPNAGKRRRVRTDRNRKPDRQCEAH